MVKKTLSIALAGLLVFSFPAIAQTVATDDRLQAVLMDEFGKTTGAASFQKTPKGVLIRIEATGLSEGWHGLHFHAAGDCSDHLDHFALSGSHASNMGQAHGFLNANGPHSGDLPNIWAGTDGTARAEFYTEAMPYEGLLDQDGAAIMIHAGPDDYASQPAGESGERIACGAIRNP